MGLRPLSRSRAQAGSRKKPAAGALAASRKTCSEVMTTWPFEGFMADIPLGIFMALDP